MNKEIAYNVMKPLVIIESTILNERNGTRQIKRKKKDLILLLIRSGVILATNKQSLPFKCYNIFAD